MTELASELPLGVALRYKREAMGLSRRALSLRAGLSDSVVGKIEAGTEPTLRVFARIAAALELNDREITFLVRLMVTDFYVPYQE